MSNVVSIDRRIERMSNYKSLKSYQRLVNEMTTKMAGLEDMRKYFVKNDISDKGISIQVEAIREVRDEFVCSLNEFKQEIKKDLT